MNPQNLTSELTTAQEQIEKLHQQALQDPGRLDLVMSEAFEEMQTMLEELQVAQEELRQQNEELIAARQEVEEERSRYQDLFNFTPDGYLVTDRTGVIKEANHAAARLFNVSEKRLVGKPLLLYIAKTDHKEFHLQLSQLQAGTREDARDWQISIQPRTGEPFPAALNVAVVRNAAGMVEGLRWLLRDITEPKRVEEQIRRMNTELARRVDEQRAELRRSTKALEEFATFASELREPLRMVQSFVTLLAERYQNRFDTKAKEFIGFAVDGAQRGQQLIQDLLSYARVELDAQEVSVTDCTPVLAHTMTRLGRSIRESEAEVTHDPLPQVMVDERQLEQVFHHLLENALKFRSPQPPRIHVSAKQAENQWVFAVRDNGIGIEPQHAERIFQVFQRLHLRREYPGTGIGLAICRRIIERHGGRIWVESEPGKGATFLFTIGEKIGGGGEKTPF